MSSPASRRGFRWKPPLARCWRAGRDGGHPVAGDRCASGDARSPPVRDGCHRTADRTRSCVADDRCIWDCRYHDRWRDPVGERREGARTHRIDGSDPEPVRGSVVHPETTRLVGSDWQPPASTVRRTPTWAPAALTTAHVESGDSRPADVRRSRESSLSPTRSSPTASSMVGAPGTATGVPCWRRPRTAQPQRRWWPGRENPYEALLIRPRLSAWLSQRRPREAVPPARWAFRSRVTSTRKRSPRRLVPSSSPSPRRWPATGQADDRRCRRSDTIRELRPDVLSVSVPSLPMRRHRHRHRHRRHRRRHRHRRLCVTVSDGVAPPERALRRRRLRGTRRQSGGHGRRPGRRAEGARPETIRPARSPPSLPGRRACGCGETPRRTRTTRTRERRRGFRGDRWPGRDRSVAAQRVFHQSLRFFLRRQARTCQVDEIVEPSTRPDLCVSRSSICVLSMRL